MTTELVQSITDELLADLDHAEKAHTDGFVRDTARAALLHIRSLTERLEKAEQDAERYRWLREQHWNGGALCVVTRPKDAVKLGNDCPSGDRLDTAIDDAIAQEGTGHE